MCRSRPLCGCLELNEMAMLIRRLLVFILCCWLPIPALAAMAFECHLVKTAPAVHHGSGTEATDAGNHSGCGGDAAAVSRISDSGVGPDSGSDTCDHCQVSCHTVQLVIFFSPLNTLPLASQVLSAYALPLPEVVFPDSPQRPPQAA